MKHYDELEWLFYKERVVSEEKYNEMENHLYECDECMNIFLSLIDNEEINSAEEIISDNFTGSVMDNIKSFKNKSISKVERTNMRFKNIFGYYVAVAAVAIILTWGGFFSSLVDTLPKAAKSAINENTLNTPNIVFNISEKIVNRTSNFIDNFQNINRREAAK